MKSYLLKIALHGVSPMVWRRIRLSGNTTLATFHEVIQICFDWDDEYLHYFRIYGVEYGISRAGTAGVFSNPYGVTIDDFEFDVGDKFTYTYNFFEFWQVDIRVESITNTDVEGLPVCISGKGMHGVSERNRIALKCQFFEAVVQFKETKDIDGIAKIARALNDITFHRKLVSNRLHNELNEPLC